MSELRQHLSFLAILQAVGCAFLFSLLIRGDWSRKDDSTNLSHWLVLRRADKYLALNASESERSTYVGFFFATVFYYAFPLWWWLWGWKRAAALIAVPMASAIFFAIFIRYGIASSSVDTPEKSSQGAGGFIFSLSLIILARVVAGIYVRKHHRRFRRLACEKRGWQLEGSVEASSAKEAVQKHSQKPKSDPHLNSTEKLIENHPRRP